nr:pleckstrin homology domain-containing family M member 1 isoform X2 [Parasteatoda tepidariorum]
MDILWKKATLPSIEDFAKDIIVKKNLTTELSKAIRNVQEENVGKSIITDYESSNIFCNVLEAILIHGLKDKLSNKMSSVFSSSPDRMPEPQFWSVVSRYSHSNVISEIKTFSNITTDIGRGRAWLRASLNDGLILSYMSTMTTDVSSLQKFYITTAFLRDKEQSDIMKQLLEGISVFSFELSCNDSALNVWNSLPLTLSNLWTPPVTPQPVMPAVDVIDFFTDPKNQAKAATKSDQNSPRIKKSSVIETQTDMPSSSCGDPSNDSDHLNQSDQNIITHNVLSSDIDDAIATRVNEMSAVQGATVNHSDDAATVDAFHLEETSSKISSSDSVPDFGLEIVDSDMEFTHIGLTGNRLSSKCGWSSAFEEPTTPTSPEQDQSYDSLLQSYNKNLNKVVIGTPELSDTFSSIMGKNEDDYCEFSEETKSPDLDFEIVPKYLSSEHADEETKLLISILGKVCPEQGLDTQNFQCYSCGRQIGFIYGKARLCYYDGYNYCYDCHDNEEEYVPARMIHNWDFKQYPVSKRAKVFLSRIVKDPMLDIKELNPVIYTAVEEMAQMQLLRTQLTFLRSYIFTCKQSIAEDLRMQLWPREYLYEHVHLYAIDDILDIQSGALAQTLQKVIAFAKKHVLACQLCLLKGFICEHLLWSS